MYKLIIVFVAIFAMALATPLPEADPKPAAKPGLIAAAYTAPLAYSAYSAPLAYSAYSAPLTYAAAPLAYSAYPAYSAYSAPYVVV